jgi:putative tryptophan/tyrosine transport system substrate-binding protein
MRLARLFLAVWLMAALQPASAQQKVRVIGILSLSAKPTLRDEVFERKLRELGWVDGRNVRIEHQRAANQVGRLPALAQELVRRKVDVIVAQATPAVQAAKGATRTIPIVSLSADPVGNGFVASLSRPGGNITGVSMMMPDLEGKHLELLKEISPKLARVAYLGHRNDPAHRLFVKHAQEGGSRLGIQVQALIVERAEDIDGAFEAMKKERAEALIVQPLFANTLGLGPRIAELAARGRLPTISSADVFADVGGLMVFGPDPTATYERIAFYVDRVLKGGNPAEMPLEQPQTFTLILNLKTAKQLAASFH